MSASTGTTTYAFDLFMCAIAYTLLVFSLIGHHGKDATFAKALGSDLKGKVSLLAYLAAMLLAFVNQWKSLALILIVAIMWFVPDRRFGAIARKD